MIIIGIFLVVVVVMLIGYGVENAYDRSPSLGLVAALVTLIFLALVTAIV